MIARARIVHADGHRGVSYAILDCDEQPDLKGTRFCPYEEHVYRSRIGDIITIEFNPDDQFAREVTHG